jgi:hypothetical protein
VVAWRVEHARGGNFGIKFTALDSGGASVLRGLCESQRVSSRDDVGSDVEQRLSRGTRVRLHIDGLGSPMKARVREKGSRKVHVASNLDFLRVGRKMQIEDLEKTSRHGASIDSLSVVVDPQTGVPQLVVALRFDEPDTTPAPSVVDLRRDGDERGQNREQRRSSSEPRHKTRVCAPDPAQQDKHRSVSRKGPEIDDDVMAEVRRMRQGVDQRAVALASRTAAAARSTTLALSRYGVRAIGTTAAWFRGAGRTVERLRPKKEAKPPRKTAPAPGGGRTLDRRGLRSQRASDPPRAQARTRPQQGGAPGRRHTMRVAASGFGVAVVIGMVAVWGPGRRAPSPPVAQVVAPQSTAKAPAAAPATVDASATATPASKSPKAHSQQGIVAEVPLFGPVPMATMEPVPRPPSGGTPATGSAEEAAEMAAAEASANETWAPENVKPWGRGPVQLPKVYRLKLDRPGSAIRGTPKAGGFAVLIPGRKARDNGAAIAESDRRIASVKTDNTSAGARITFRFRDEVPGYRVRLAGQYVEFLVSSPK